MIGLDPLTLSTVLILAGTKLECPDRPATKVNIVPRAEKTQYDTSQSLKQIQSYSTDTVDPYGFHGQSITQGFMRGAVGVKTKVSYDGVVNERFGFGCIWYKEINVEIYIEPTIVIAREIYADKCMRNAVLGHEQKHVRVDREIVNKYARQIGDKLMAELKTRGFSAGPFDTKRKDEIKAKMDHVIQQIVTLEQQKMDIERLERQRAVDTLEEYDSVDDQCPDFEKKKERIYADLLR